jgi:hypothetical protein
MIECFTFGKEEREKPNGDQGKDIARLLVSVIKTS